MNEKDVTFFSTLLNIKAEDVKGAIEDGSLGEKVQALGLVSKTDVETLKTNLTREVKTNYLNELGESAKKGELPQEIYKPVSGAVLEMKEKKLAKEYGITEYDGLDDLVSKAITNTAKPDDTKLQEQLDKIAALQTANTKLVSEKDEAVSQANKEKNDWILNKEKSDYINQVPFDFSDVNENELDDVTNKRKQILTSVFDSQFTLGFKDDKITVFKGDNALLNETTFEPVPISDVLKGTATELGMKLKSPETGGQGGSSSGQKNSRFKNQAEFMEHCASKGIAPTSAEGLKLYKESGLHES